MLPIERRRRATRTSKADGRQVDTPLPIALANRQIPDGYKVLEPTAKHSFLFVHISF